MKVNRIILVVLAASLFSACGGGSPTNNKRTDTASESAAKAPVIDSKGKALFEQRCAACHGTDGTAGIAGAANLRTSKLDSAAIGSTISKGRNAMPSFGSQLTAKEIEDIAGYVMLLRK